MPKVVIVDIDSHFYKSSEGEDDDDLPYNERRGWPIRRVCSDESAHFKVTNERNGMYHLTGKYGNLGWVYPSAIIEWL